MPTKDTLDVVENGTPKTSALVRVEAPRQTPAPPTRTAPPTSKYGTLLHQVMAGTDIPCEFVLPGGERHRFGEGEPAFRATFHTEKALRNGFDEYRLGQAYVEGDIDIEGDLMRMLDLRDQMQHKVHWPLLLKLWRMLFFRRPARVNKESIANHYTLGDDFYLSFIDTAYRFYSHGYFYADDETLEQASTHKLEVMFDALELGPGKRLLDIGAGWGAVHQYCGPRGVHVTSLTLAEDSLNYTNGVIQRLGLADTCAVRLEDFLDHHPDAPYDAIVIYGVIEHIPNYRRFIQRVHACLKPGGRLFLDASASKEMDDVSDFTRTYIWSGTHAFLCLHELLQELAYNGLDLLSVENDSHDYYLTMWHWATRFEEHRDFIVERWGEQIYRAFQVYLWGGSHAMKNDLLQAYHLVARKSVTPGPRPGLLRRTGHFIRNVVR